MKEKEIENEDRETKLLQRKRNSSPQTKENITTQYLSQQQNEIKKSIIYDSINYKILINEAFDSFLKGQNDKFLIIHEKLEKHKKTKANNIAL